MAGSRTEQFDKALQGWRFSDGGRHWELVTCGTHEWAGDLVLHVALIGESILTLAIHVERALPARLATRRIADRIADWLAEDDCHEQGYIDAT